MSTPGTFLTSDIIAKEAIASLQANLVMANLVNRQYDSEFGNVGAIVQVKKPPTFTATTFTSSTSPETIVEGSVNVTLDTIFDVSVEVTAKELSLNIQDFGQTVVNPAMAALAQKIDSSLCGLYIDVPYFAGAYNATPDALTDPADCMKYLNKNRVPFADRNFVLNPQAHAGLIVLDNIVAVDNSGSPAALRNALMGRILGLESYVDQNVVTHQRGTFVEASGTLLTTVSAAATTMTITNASCSGTLLKGDLIRITMTNGTVYDHVVTANATSGSNNITVSIYPAIAENITAGVVTIQGAVLAGATRYANSLAFHKDAFCLVTKPLAPAIGGADSSTLSWNGLSIRVTKGYTMSSKINSISFDILCGFKTLSPERAVRLIGNIG